MSDSLVSDGIHLPAAPHVSAFEMEELHDEVTAIEREEMLPVSSTDTATADVISDRTGVYRFPKGFPTHTRVEYLKVKYMTTPLASLTSVSHPERRHSGYLKHDYLFIGYARGKYLRAEKFGAAPGREPGIYTFLDVTEEKDNKGKLRGVEVLNVKNLNWTLEDLLKVLEDQNPKYHLILRNCWHYAYAAMVQLWIAAIDQNPEDEYLQVNLQNLAKYLRSPLFTLCRRTWRLFVPLRTFRSKSSDPDQAEYLLNLEIRSCAKMCYLMSLGGFHPFSREVICKTGLDRADVHRNFYPQNRRPHLHQIQKCPRYLYLLLPFGGIAEVISHMLMEAICFPILAAKGVFIDMLRLATTHPALKLLQS